MTTIAKPTRLLEAAVRPSSPHLTGTRSRRRRGRSAILHLALAVGAVAMLLPFIFMISTSLNADAWLTIPFPAQLVPDRFSLEAYRVAVEGMDIGRLYLNTFLVAAVEILLSLISALLSGYALSKIRPRGSGILLVVILTTMMIPSEATLIPNFITFQTLGMIDTYLPFWIPALAYTFGTFFVKQYLDNLPWELREAAKIDGASELRTLFGIYVPLATPVIATCAILLFLSVWNSFLWPLVVINSPSLYTLQIGIAAFSQSVGGTQYLLPTVNMAATVLSVIPVLVVYLVLQRYIVASVASSAIKG